MELKVYTAIKRDNIIKKTDSPKVTRENGIDQALKDVSASR